MSKNSTKIIMIGVFKGGVGKTTTTINLGHALALQKKNVLILDLDPQGNTTRGLGYEVTELTPTVYTVIKGISRASESIGRVKENLFLLPSNRTTALLETELASEVGREKALTRAMKEIEGFDYILLDCGPGSTIVNVNGLVFSTDVLMPIEIGVDSVEGVDDFIKAKEAICQKLEIDTRLMGAVMTKVDRRLTLTETILSHCKTSFKGKFFAQIRTDTNLGHARGYRQTIFEYDSRSRAAEDYAKMATDVIKWFKRSDKADGK
jgi:chromosome partitioning protein